MHVERNRDKILSDALADDVALVVGRILEQLLAEVVAEGICCGNGSVRVERTALTDCGVRTGHEIREVSECLAENDIAMLRDALFKLLLQVTATMLVLAQVRDLANEVLETRAREAVD